MLGTFFRHGATAALAVCALALLALIVAGLAPIRPLDVVIGALLFYGSEYLMHRFAFHAPPARSPSAAAAASPALRPSRRARPARPVVPAAVVPRPQLAATAALVALVLGPAATASAMLGVVAAILHYERTHYVAHTPIRPLTPLGRWIKQYHLRHH